MTSLDKANLTRVRDNQRRSRARRKEYVQELEKQLRVHKDRGTEVSSKIQQAARKVAEDNKKLRVLLNSLGFNNERIGCFLQTGSLNAAENVALNSLDDHEGMVRALDQLLETRPPANNDYRSHATSLPQNIAVDNTNDTMANSLAHSQANRKAPVTEAGEHAQRPSCPAVFGFETQGCPQPLLSPILPGHLSTQDQLGLIELPDRPQFIQGFQYESKSSFRDTMYHPYNTNPRQQLEEDTLGAPLSSLPFSSRRTSSSFSVDDIFQNSLPDDSENFDYYPVLQCGVYGNANHLALSLDTM
ncbi:hypothetical protein F4819DRAFT_167804 [Hypoxylon fuscum]|nr:hypothetical protein F4819DRAFT_167804 [Hypoxylon fuscum]